MLKGPFIPALSLGVGIAVSAMCSLPWWSGILTITASLALYFFIINASKDPVAAFRLGKWHILWVVFLFFGIGLTDQSLTRPSTIEDAFEGNMPDTVYCEVKCVLTKVYGDRIDVVIKHTNGAQARIRSGSTDLSSGDIIAIPSKFLTPISSDTTEIGRRLAPMLKASGIMYTGRVVTKHIHYVGRSSNLRYFFIGLREKTEAAIERSHLSKHTSDFIKAILMGDKTGLDEQTRMTFANGGIAHMLALSGLHIGILAGFLMLMMWPLKLLGHYKWGYAATILCLWLYVAVTGMAYSSVRAAIMTTFAFLGIIAERKNLVGNSLCSGCLIILIFEPSALFNAGFQLSVVCVGALIAFASRLNPIGHRHHPVIFNICGAVLATIVATGASWVLISFYFSQIPLMFLPTNLILLPLLPIYLSIAVIFTLLLCMGLEIGWLGYALDGGFRIFMKTAEWLSGGTEFVIEYQIPIWGVVIWLIMMAAAAYAINRKEMI